MKFEQFPEKSERSEMFFERNAIYFHGVLCYNYHVLVEICPSLKKEENFNSNDLFEVT